MKISEMGRDRGLVLALLLASATTMAAAPDFSVGGQTYQADGFIEWKLPNLLREISGMTTDEQGRLFAHGDEHAIIHQIDFVSGGIIKSFALGDPPVPGDFEGITRVDGQFYLATSDGDLYIAEEGGPGARMPYRMQRTGLGARCEIEGVEYSAPRRLLYFICKTPREPALKGRLTILAWSLERQALDADHTISIEAKPVRKLLGKRPLRPTAIATLPATGDLVLIARREGVLAVVTPTGELVTTYRLPQAERLKQIEALAIGPNNELILGSEGQNGRGRLRVYNATR